MSFWKCCAFFSSSSLFSVRWELNAMKMRPSTEFHSTVAFFTRRSMKQNKIYVKRTRVDIIKMNVCSCTLYRVRLECNSQFDAWKMIPTNGEKGAEIQVRNYLRTWFRAKSKRNGMSIKIFIYQTDVEMEMFENLSEEHLKLIRSTSWLLTIYGLKYQKKKLGNHNPTIYKNFVKCFGGKNKNEVDWSRNHSENHWIRTNQLAAIKTPIWHDTKMK